MAALGITSRDSILRAIEEFDRLGRDEFLRVYGFGRAKGYILLYNGEKYDSKAIIGVARKYEPGSSGPGKPSDFSGGEKRVVPVLERFGFEVRYPGRDHSKDAKAQLGPRYWAVCADPRQYRVLDAVREREFDTWTTKNKSIQAGDRLMIWKTAGKDEHRGVVAFAEVISDPQVRGDADNPYWIVPDDSPAPRVQVRYVRSPNLPLWIGGEQSALLEELSVARARGGTDFTVSPDQWDAVVKAAGGLLNEEGEPEIDLPPIGDVTIPIGDSSLIRTRTGSSGQGVAGSGGSRRSRNAKAVGDRAEEIALEYIKRYVPENTKVDWVANQGETPGWDIQYRNADGDLIAVEVKGTTASYFSTFELTQNELDAARRLSNRYWLYLVADCGGASPQIQRIQNPVSWVDEERINLKPIRWQASFC